MELFWANDFGDIAGWDTENPPDETRWTPVAILPEQDGTPYKFVEFFKKAAVAEGLAYVPIQNIPSVEIELILVSAVSLMHEHYVPKVSEPKEHLAVVRNVATGRRYYRDPLAQDSDTPWVGVESGDCFAWSELKPSQIEIVREGIK